MHMCQKGQYNGEMKKQSRIWGTGNAGLECTGFSIRWSGDLTEKVSFEKMTGYRLSGNYEYQLVAKNMSSFESQENCIRFDPRPQGKEKCKQMNIIVLQML